MRAAPLGPLLLLHILVAQACSFAATPLTSHVSPITWAGGKMRDRPVAFRAKEVSTAPVLDVLDGDGVVRINGALSSPVGATLLAHVNDALEVALRRMSKEASLDLGDNVLVRYFGNVMEKVNRHDLKLELTPPVRAAVLELLDTLYPVFKAHLGEDAMLYELAALVSDPGSPRQPLRPDTPCRSDQGTAVLTAFVALQDIDESMGPTSFLPSSHNAEAHAAFNNVENGAATRIALLRSRPCWRGLLKSGDLNLFDSRLLHSGGANESPRRRVLFYVSFRAKDANAPPGTLLYDLRDKYSLCDLVDR